MKPVVVHIITGLNTGGAEQMLARLVARHADSGFHHHVICLTDEGPVADQIRSTGVTVQNLGMARGLPNPVAVRRLAGMIRDQNATVVQTWLYHADLVGGLAARMARVPVAWGIHHSRLDPQTASRSLKLTVRSCALLSGRIPQAIVCCAESSRLAHVELGYDSPKMLVIPNGFDTSVFRPDPESANAIRRELGIGSETRLIGIAGRFVPLKNHRLFVAAAGRVAARDRSVAFLMAGDGLDLANPELQSWIVEAGLSGRIHLLGRRSDLNRVLAALDFCVLTSRTEAFPMVIGEAMATGVPGISTDVGDAAYLIGDTGRIVPSEDVEALATALNDVLGLDSESVRSMGERARGRMIEHFDIRAIQVRYERLWSALAVGESPCE